MLGRAMFTTVMSRMIMSWAPSTRARAMPRRSGRRAVRWRPAVVVIGAIDEVDMNAFLERSCGRACPAGNVPRPGLRWRSEEHTSELQSHLNLVCRLLLEKKKNLSHDRTTDAR